MVPRVSVLIPAKNGGPRLLQVVAAVLAQEIALPFEVLVVDSGSTDGIPEALARGPVRVLSVPAVSYNHGATRNYGIGMSRGDIVALLVQDALPLDRHWLAPLVAALKDDPKAAGAYSRQLPDPRHPAFVRRALEGYEAGRAEPRVQEIDAATLDRLTPAGRLHALCFDNVASAIRRSVWRKHPFAPLPFAEDLDWSRRVLSAGHRILYVPSSRVIHSHDRGPLYELRRAYACHKALRAVVGLRLIPDGRALARALPAAALGNAAIERREGTGGLTWLPRQARAAAVGMASALGQYLSQRASPRLDHWLLRGV